MMLIKSLVILSLVAIGIEGYPSRYYSSSGNTQTWTRPADANHGAMVLNRYHDPYYNHRAVRSGPTTYSLLQPDPTELQQAQHYHAAARRQTLLEEVNDTPQQENEVYFPLPVENSPFVPTEATDLLDPVQNSDTPKTDIIPEVPEPEKDLTPNEPAQVPKTAVTKKTQPKKPVEEEEDEEDDSYPRLPNGAFFPMFFGWGGKSGGGGPLAVANSFSTGRGGASTSHAIAFGTPKGL